MVSSSSHESIQVSNSPWLSLIAKWYEGSLPTIGDWEMASRECGTEQASLSLLGTRYSILGSLTFLFLFRLQLSSLVSSSSLLGSSDEHRLRDNSKDARGPSSTVGFVVSALTPYIISSNQVRLEG